MVDKINSNLQPQPRRGVDARRPSDRVIRRRQIAAAGVAGLLTIGGGLVGVVTQGGAESHKGGGMPNEVPYIARPGERLWDIAEKIEASTDGVAGDDDVRPIVADLQGQLSDGVLHAGDTLMVPESANNLPNVPGAQSTRE